VVDVVLPVLFPTTQASKPVALENEQSRLHPSRVGLFEEVELVLKDTLLVQLFPMGLEIPSCFLSLQETLGPAATLDLLPLLTTTPSLLRRSL
jgi:hypothetical protein